MSYILDALNKSEQERQKQQDQSLQEQIHSIDVPVRRNTGFHFWISGATLIAVVFGYYLATVLSEQPADDRQQTDHLTPLDTQTALPTDSLLTESTVSKDTTAEETLNLKRASLDATAPADTGGTQNTADNEPVAVLPVTALPKAVRRQIPTIEYTAHVFSSSGGTGFVILNDSIRYEGYRVSEGLYVKTIESDGVVMDYNGTVFKLTAMKSWFKH